MKDKKKIKVSNQAKIFAKQMFNYALSLYLINDLRSINELSELIKIQNERRVSK